MSRNYRIAVFTALAGLSAGTLHCNERLFSVGAEDGGATSGSGTSGGGTSGAAHPTSCDFTQSAPTLESGETVVDAGGLPAVAKTACTDSTETLSHTRGIGLDISRATGYTANPAIPTIAASLLPANDVGALANQMRGTPPDLSSQDLYRTLDDPNTNIKGILFRDGPRGVNLNAPVYTGPYGGLPEDLGAGYATVFPVTSAHGATWDIDLEAQIGQDVGDEVLASGNDMTFSPCVNILRNPAWGRSQEAYGEDSFAIGRMATAYVDGVQNYIPACVKHFAANNIENDRQNLTAVMDSQTLHEIYGRHFEMIVQEGGVACVMASYNGIQLTDGPDQTAYKNALNPILLDGVLRGTFGFKGFVVSDLWALPGYKDLGLPPQQYSQNATSAVAAGLDVELPWNLDFANLETLAPADQLRAAATYIVEQKLRFNTAGQCGSQAGLKTPTTSLGPNGITNNGGHIADAEKQAEEAMVLLKNDQSTLPIRRGSVRSVAVIGAAVPWSLSGTGESGTVQFATDVVTGDHGSSRVNLDPSASVGPAAGIAAAAGNAIVVTSGTDPSLADSADFVVVVAGMTPQDEGEDFTGASDRADANGVANYSLDPKSSSPTQDSLIEAVAAKGKPTAVVLEGGSAINMPWLGSVGAVVMAWYPGQAGGTALGKLLFGDVNFSGKLPITWPKSEADEPPFNEGVNNAGLTTMDYYLGYRWFDHNGITPLFAFGSGSSYTTFNYAFLGVPCSTVTKNGVVDVQVAVTNTGTVAGNEVSYLFVSFPNTTARRSVKELKGFHRSKAPIQPGQTVLFTIPLRIQDLKYWNSTATPPGWTVESGLVRIMVGSSSDNLPLTDTLIVQ